MTLVKPHHHRHVGARFSAAAHTYTDASHLQDRVARRVMDMVPEDHRPLRILDAGCGPGRLLTLARHRWSEAELVGVDIAPGMIRKSRHLFADDPRATFVEEDMVAFHDRRMFDLVISSSAMHWLRPFRDGLAHVASQCRPGGLLALGIMLDGTLGELRAAREAVAPRKAAPGRLPTLKDLEDAARTIEGCRVRRIEQTTAEYDQASASDVLRSVHDMGVTAGDVSRGRAPLARGEIKALAAWYDQHYASPNGVRVTFVVGYLLLEREP